MMQLRAAEIHVWTVPRAWEAAASDVLARYRQGPHTFERTPLGKPFIAGGGLEIGVSHTDGLSVFALSAHAFGIDVERCAPLGMRDWMGTQALAPAEAREIGAAPASEREARFYRCWVRKEALLKARGSGLLTDPREIDTSWPARGWRWLDDERDGVAIALAASHPQACAIWMGAAR